MICKLAEPPTQTFPRRPNRTMAYRKGVVRRKKRRKTRDRHVIGRATGIQKAMRLAYYGDRCWICQRPHPRFWDHVIPIGQGGTNFPSNLRPCCFDCNSKKGGWESNKKRNVKELAHFVEERRAKTPFESDQCRLPEIPKFRRRQIRGFSNYAIKDAMIRGGLL